MSKFISLIGFLALVFAISFISSQVTMPAVASWYQEINKPSWTPPDWVFAPVWTTLYVMIAISGWLIWQKLPTEKFSKKLTIGVMFPYWAQLALNFSWSLVFFGMANSCASSFIIIGLLMAIWMNIKSFYPLSKAAAWLLAPYFLWVAYASTLNIGIFLLNK